MKDIESSPGSSRRPSRRHNNVVISTVIMLLGLAGLLWWNNANNANINPNNIASKDAIPGTDGFNWHKVFMHQLLDQHRLTGVDHTLFVNRISRLLRWLSMCPTKGPDGLSPRGWTWSSRCNCPGSFASQGARHGSPIWGSSFDQSWYVNLAARIQDESR